MRKENVSGHFAAALPAGVARIAETIMDQSHRSRMLSFNLRPTPTKSVEEHQLIIDADQKGAYRWRRTIVAVDRGDTKQ